MEDRQVKKLLYLLVLLILALPLFSSVTFSPEVDEETALYVTSLLDKAVGDRGDVEIVVSDYREEEGAIRCTFSFFDKTVDFVSSKEYLEDDIDSLFYYEEGLFEEGERLDYIYRDTFSSVSLLNAKRGQNYVVRSASGKIKALLEVDRVYDSAVLLQPRFLSSPLPGMKMEKINDFSISLKGFTNKTFRSYGVSLSLSYSSLCYPLIPFVEAAYIRGTSNTFYGLAGLSGFFSLGSVWPDAAVIRNIGITGEFALGAQYASSLKLSGKYGISLSYTFGRYLSIALSLLNYGGSNYYSLGAFVKL